MPHVPDDLAARMAEGETVLFAGAGLSRPRLPGWSELLEQMLVWPAASRSRSVARKTPFAI